MTSTLSRLGSGLLGGGVLLLIAALVLANPVLAATGLTLLAFAGLGSALPTPGVRSIAVDVSPTEGKVGDRFRADVRLETTPGIGGLELHVQVPNGFELSQGTNLRLFTFAGAASRLTWTMTLRALQRGSSRVGSATIERSHALGLLPATLETIDRSVEVRVHPRASAVRRLRTVAARAATLFPTADASRAGIATMDFRDLREYGPGDNPRSINWRATARRAARGPGAVPLVNEYDREGRKNVWVFLDGHVSMSVGSSVVNGLEHAIEGALGVARHYLDRGYRVGFATFRHDPPLLLRPESGHEQLLRMRRSLVDLRASPAGPGLDRSVREARRLQVAGRSLGIVFTRPERADSATEEGLRLLRRWLGTRRRRKPILVVAPDVVSLQTQRDAGPPGFELLARALARPSMRRWRRGGVRVLAWDATKASIEALLHRHGGRA